MKSQCLVKIVLFFVCSFSLVYGVNPKDPFNSPMFDLLMKYKLNNGQYVFNNDIKVQVPLFANLQNKCQY